MTLWMDGGRHGGRTLVSQGAVSRALSPGWPIRAYRTGFTGLALSYGHIELLESLRERALTELRRTDAKLVDHLPATAAMASQ